jgi:hypothetical protein
MSFRLFSRGEKFFGGRSDTVEEANQKGAMLIFDSWEETDYFQMRLWHCSEDLEISLEGSGFKEIEREINKHICQYWCFDTDKEIDYEDYCTIVRFSLTESEGSVSVSTNEDFPFDDVAKVSWSEGKITDLDEKEAHLDFVSNYYKVREILTLSQRREYILEDRIDKLLKISRSQQQVRMRLYSSRYHILKTANMSDEEYAKWIQEET